MSREVVIKAKNLTKSYRLYDSHLDRVKEAFHPFRKKYHHAFNALTNVSFEVRKGETLGIIGRNGSGKSTLLQIICGIIPPTKGEVVVNGRVSALLELGAGFNPEFTGRQNLYLNGSILGLTRKEIDARFNEIVEFAEIGDFIDQPVKTYSSGMYVRLAFAIAINVEPEILVVDEALAVGDELFRRKCYARIEEFREAGKTILFVTHDMPTVNELCARTIFLDKGELILEGPASFVTTQYERFLFTRSEDALKIRNEILEINRNGELKKKLLRESLKEKTQQKETEKDTHKAKAGKKSFEISEKRPWYVPDFRPKSTVEYKNFDVDIFDILIETPDGQRVNHLLMNEEYVYSYKVRFNTEGKNVFFGMMIKNDKGLNITGANAPSPQSKGIPHIKKGEVYYVKWFFKCTLLPGIYYTNAGVSGKVNGETCFLNRIVDAQVFKVHKNTDAKYDGLVHLSQYAEIRLL